LTTTGRKLLLGNDGEAKGSDGINERDRARTAFSPAAGESEYGDTHLEKSDGLSPHS
jgi:hypothetical protein